MVINFSDNVKWNKVMSGIHLNLSSFQVSYERNLWDLISITTIFWFVKAYTNITLVPEEKKHFCTPREEQIDTKYVMTPNNSNQRPTRLT